VVRFLAIAEIELDEVIRWYHTQASGLGDVFLIEVLAATNRIAHHSMLGSYWMRACAAAGLTGFPGLIYMVENGDILVLAVAHLHRRPACWRDRLQH
jgi:hypothetical protein